MQCCKQCRFEVAFEQCSANAVVIATHAAQRNAAQCSTMQHNAAQCSTMQHKHNAVAKKNLKKLAYFKFLLYIAVLNLKSLKFEIE